ncbi:MAG: hypothetical protein ACRDY7_13055 [Acidimicrobiia bacterium]
MNFLKLCRNQWDRTLGVVLVLGGFVALLAGWLSVRDTIFTFRQMPSVISGGLVGVSLIALGAASWVSADLRDEWRKLDDLESKVDALTASLPEAAALVLPDGQDQAVAGGGASGPASSQQPSVRVRGGA